MPDDERLQVDVEDGRRYLTRNDERYDVIVLDAFYADSVPFHLTTLEFLQLVHERLNPGGVVVTNVIGAERGSQSKLLRSMYRTYRAVFPTVAVHPVHTRVGETPDEVKNVIFVSTDSPAPAKEFLRERWRQVRAKAPRAPDLTKPIADRYETFIPTGDVPVLTDDYAPTDALLLLFG